jgi:hypothetical protein
VKRDEEVAGALASVAVRSSLPCPGAPRHGAVDGPRRIPRDARRREPGCRNNANANANNNNNNPPPLFDPSQGTCSPGTGGVICRWIHEATGSQTAADVTLWLIEKPLKIVLIIALAWIVVRLGKRAIRALVGTLPKRVTHPGQVEDADERLREQQRNASIERLLVRLLRFTVWFVAIVMILDVLGINMTPVIVSAGILGLALSLGAQTMVKDLVGGISIIVDRRLAVGDFVDLADPTGHVGTPGVVEAVGLSSTTLRNGDGEIWHVPNGDIRWIGNLSERWARIVIDVRVGYGTDLRAAKETFSAALGGGRRRRALPRRRH